MSARGTFGVVLLAAALGGGYWYWEVKSKPAREEAAEAAKRVFPELKAEETGEILLRKEKDPEVLLRKIAGEWRLVAPVQALADKDAVEELLKQLKVIQRAVVVEDKASDFHKYGLDEPSGAVTFLPVSGGAKAQVLFFGADSFDGSKAYAMVDGKDGVFLTDLAGKRALLKDADGLRDKHLLNFTADAVSAVRSSQGGGFLLNKDRSGAWQVSAAGRVEPGAPEKIQAWLSQLSALKGDSVADETGKDAARYALGGVKIEIELQGGGKQALQRGKLKDKGPQFYGRVQGMPAIWLMPASAGAVFEQNGRALMDLHAFSFQPGSVEHFTVWQKGTTVTARRKEDFSWAWDPAPLKAVPGQKAFDFPGFIAKVSGAERLSHLADSAKPAHPEALVTFYDQAGQVLEVAWAGGPQGPGRVAYSGVKKMASIVAKDLFDGIPPPADKR